MIRHRNRCAAPNETNELFVQVEEKFTIVGGGNNQRPQMSSRFSSVFLIFHNQHITPADKKDTWAGILHIQLTGSH